MKKIIIFGATGGTGKQLVEQSLEQGHAITAFVRNPKKLKLEHPNLRILTGDVRDYDDVHAAMLDQEIVMCCLGTPASDKTKLRTTGTDIIIRAMKARNIDRLICQTSLGFGDSKAVLPFHMKYIIVPFILKDAFADHESQEALIKNSGLNWTIVRPGNMTNGKRTKKYKFNFDFNETIKLKVSRADVADFMLKQIGLDEFTRKTVGISY